MKNAKTVGHPLKLPMRGAAACVAAAFVLCTPALAQTQDPDPRPPVVVEEDALRLQRAISCTVLGPMFRVAKQRLIR